MHADPFIAPFFGQHLPLVAAVAKQMIAYGIGPEEALIRYQACMDAMQALSVAPRVSVAAGKDQPALSISAPICPECGAAVRISPVNVSKCTNVGGEWRSSISCLNQTCRFTELSTKTMDEWRSDHAV